MEKGDLIIAIFWMVCGIIITITSYSLGLGTFATPGAGLMPFGIGIILSICSFPILIRSFMSIKKARERDEQGVWFEVDFKRIGLVLASLIGYLVLLERLGFLVTAFFIFLILFKAVGSQRWNRALIATILTLCFAYLLFALLLNVYMPPFPLWR